MIIHLLEVFARAGGGGSAGGGSSASAEATGGIIQALAVGFVFAIVMIIYVVRRRLRLLKKLRLQKKLVKLDPKWNEQVIKARAEKVFMDFQKDWSKMDTHAMNAYLTPSLHQHVGYMLAAMQDMRRGNDMKKVRIHKMTVMDLLQRKGSVDSFFIEIKAQANDSLIDERTGKTLYTDKNKFTEYWQFVWMNDTWKLYDIQQGTQSRRSQMRKLRRFAIDSGMYYSLDWGWLLLPQRGQLFSKATFKWSDVNNHLIGEYHKLIVQIYSYAPRRGNENIKQYVVAQVAVPKTYGNIVVLRRGWLPLRKPKNMKLTKLQTEWTKFNKKYEIYASDLERATSFELLHPVFMEKLEALPFKVNIEVVDNVVYLYTKDKKADYGVMLSLLKDAFKEMKM